MWPLKRPVGGSIQPRERLLQFAFLSFCSHQKLKKRTWRNIGLQA